MNCLPEKRVSHISRTKTYREGEDVFFAQQGGSSDPEQALLYHLRINELPPGGAFNDRFKNGHRPLTKQKFIERLALAARAACMDHLIRIALPSNTCRITFPSKSSK
ncbi:hypothetical protein AZE42_10697 [Rhizopogon vesiculosus]|uniref:Uncharacterized protein n=1 Tax=Rhizopogon vesiculosus TaxID=180088 RepID=A0A1J8Q4I6_9AGAM|nr:hypothetical protein AZE42_10697 [Rhizopogon vesiculosus]